MKLIIRYEDETQCLELNAEDTEQLWISLSLEGEDLSQEEKEGRIQDAFNQRFNKPEYNNFHKGTRHIGYSKARLDDEEDDEDSSEPLMSEVVDPDIFRQYELKNEWQQNYEETCAKVRKVLTKKPHWAEAFIAVRIDGMSVNDYAASVGVEDSSVISKWLGRAEKKLQEFFKNRQI